MDTKYFKIDQNHMDRDSIEQAAEMIRRGGLVAIPTETVYGLGANALDENAVLRIFQAKGRPRDNPLIVHIAKTEELENYCVDIPKEAYDLAGAFWPGPLTMVLKARPNIPAATTAGLDTVAVRCPENPVARAIIEAAGVPVAAPSANLSGKPSPTRAEHVLNDLNGRIDAVVDGGPCDVGVESSIVDLTGPEPRLLRPGGLPAEKLEEVLGKKLAVDPAVYGEVGPDETVRAPGMKHKHYAPQAQVVFVQGSAQSAARYIQKRANEKAAVLCPAEEQKFFPFVRVAVYGSMDRPETLAQGLFSGLRELDTRDTAVIYARCPDSAGILSAVVNRLLKAAGFNSVDSEMEA